MKIQRVIASDVVDDFYSGCFPGCESEPVESLSLQASEKLLHRDIVRAVAFSAHPGSHAVPVQLVLVIIASILAASIGIVQQAGQRLAVPLGHGQRVQGDNRQGLWAYFTVFHVGSRRRLTATPTFSP
jgi:hypothetical protein